MHVSILSRRYSSPRGPCAPGHSHCRRFFRAILRVMTRALGSPKTSRTVGSGRKQGKAYVSHSQRLGLKVDTQDHAKSPPPVNGVLYR